ncbi:MAG: hypothetical protein EA367_16615 [Leptolyngbya sp. DLM2.Bin15]|nr:MAG: hypothetical protein EA367_16615 [Leptolyngbya sp. DLM2.Bin15]
MAIHVPSLDDRAYADILRDALARIPVHNPEWTNFNDSDPGVTILQLFAFMTESILYRANQIPERNRLKFLQLLGIPVAAATAAQGFVTLTNDRGPLDALPLQPGLDVRAGQVRFLTTQGLEVLPITAQLFYKRPTTTDQAALYQQLYADLLDDDTEQTPAFYETTPMAQPSADGTLPVLDLATTVDGCLWMALLARTAAELPQVRSHLVGKTLTVGVMPWLEEDQIKVAAGEVNRLEDEPAIHWEIADASRNPGYRPLTTRSFGPLLSAPGLIELTLPDTIAQLTPWNFAALGLSTEGTGDYPPSLADTNLGDRLVTWIRLRLDRSEQTPTSLKARMSWMGINATQIQQRIAVTGEMVGTGTGEPDQQFQLANHPVLPETVVLTVGGDRWSTIPDLLAADPEVPVGRPRRPLYAAEMVSSSSSRSRVFTLDPESGTITFGDGIHGARPTQQIVVSYAFGGGKQGNVALGAIDRSPQLPAGFKVTNPLHTWGGDDAQDTASAEKSIARYVQHRDRLVSVQDFEDITRRTPGIDLGRVAAIPLFRPRYPDPEQPGQWIGPMANFPGAVTVMVIPAHASETAYPRPDSLFLSAVCHHLQPRRLVTTELYVRGPDYINLWVSVGIMPQGGYATGPLREAVKQALYRFLSPLYGGPVPKGSDRGSGWPLTVTVSAAELAAVVARVEGVRQINDALLLGRGAEPVSRVGLSGLELPRLARLSVVIGSAVPLAQLGDDGSSSTTPPSPETEWVPIPILPERC